MIIDEENQKDKNKMIEVLIGDDKTSVWVMAMATDLRIMDNDRNLNRVKAIRVRDLEAENG